MGNHSGISNAGRESSPSKWRSPWRLAAWAGLTTGTLAVLFVVAFLLFPDALVNQFLKGRNISTFEKTYPEYSLQLAGLAYDFSEDRLGCDSLWLTPTDSGFACNITGFSVSGIGWLELLRGQALTPDLLTDSDIDAEAVSLTFPRLQYQMSSGRLHISVSDSEIVAENLALRPIDQDDEFFATDEFRRTRYLLDVPHARMTGSACLGMLRRSVYRGRFVQLHDPILDVLTNKSKPSRRNAIPPLMPQELISSIQAAIQIDSLSVSNGTVRYGERVAIGTEAATITVDSLDAAIGGIANRCCERDSTLIEARGRLMEAGTFHLNMSMPVASSEFSLRCTASLIGMRLDALNPFVTISDQVRVKSGYLKKGELSFSVTAGRATGTLVAVYNDLAIALQDGNTGSENGILNRVKSLVANDIVLRTHNGPDKSGAMKIGKVSYTRKHDDAFFKFMWLTVNSGMKDVVGY